MIMAKGIAFSYEGKDYVLAPGGGVYVGGAEQAGGVWTSQSSEEENRNKLVVTVGSNMFRVPATYNFTSRNQLEVGVTVGDGVESSTPYVVPGKIIIDDGLDIRYRPLSAPGVLMEEKDDIVLYGNLSFESVLALRIDLIGGGSTVILANQYEPVKTGSLRRAGMPTQDELIFQAQTMNMMQIDGVIKFDTQWAEVGFAGGWGFEGKNFRDPELWRTTN